jgi:hypothetical protein
MKEALDVEERIKKGLDIETAEDIEFVKDNKEDEDEEDDEEFDKVHDEL